MIIYITAATLGGWGISMNKFEGKREGKNNLCRETNAEKALSILANSTTLEYFYSTFQRFPPFNREYMEKICTNINNSKTIPCILTNMTMKDKHGNIIRKIVSRPDVSKNYHEKSETIYAWDSAPIYNILLMWAVEPVNKEQLKNPNLLKELQYLGRGNSFDVFLDNTYKTFCLSLFPNVIVLKHSRGKCPTIPHFGQAPGTLPVPTPNIILSSSFCCAVL